MPLTIIIELILALFATMLLLLVCELDRRLHEVEKRKPRPRWAWLAATARMWIPGVAACFVGIIAYQSIHRVLPLAASEPSKDGELTTVQRLFDLFFTTDASWIPAVLLSAAAAFVIGFVVQRIIVAEYHGKFAGLDLPALTSTINESNSELGTLGGRVDVLEEGAQAMEQLNKLIALALGITPLSNDQQSADKETRRVPDAKNG